MTQLRKRVIEELDRRNYSKATVRAYVSAIRQFAEYFHRSPERLGTEQIRQFQTYLFQDRKLASHTVMQRMCALRFLYWKVLKRPFRRDDLPLPKTPRKLPTVLSPEETARLIHGAANLRHRTILMTLYATGMRRAEVCRLQAQDIDRARMMIHIRQGKGGKDRDVPLSSTLLHQLITWWRSLPDKSSPWLFPNHQHRFAGQPMRDKTVWNACRFAARRAGLAKRIHPHTLRHSFATHLVEAGTDLITVKELMGHADLRDTELYVHLSKRHLEAPTNPLDALELVVKADGEPKEK
ncbi:MAG TPA: site-specific integrase [Bryobacteraceae bacterium]|nr:site-specific integrase [Bryobacteraceae bacterium]